MFGQHIHSGYRFSIAACLELLQPVAEHVHVETVVQAELEEFGIEFRYTQTLTARQQLLAAGVDREWVDQTIHSMRQYLRGILPWTPGPPRPDGNQLDGNIQFTTLTVTVSPPAMAVEPPPDDDICDDYYPERLRRAYGRL